MGQKPVRGKNILIVAVCCLFLLALVLGIWRASIAANRSREKSVSEAGQKKDTQKEIETKASSRDQIEEQQKSEGAENPNPATGANSEQGSSVPDISETVSKSPTISRPKGLIIVDSPRNGDVIIASAFTLSGRADVSGDTLFYKVEDAQGQQWVAGASEVSGKGEDFSIIISLRDCRYLTSTKGSPRRLNIRIYNDLDQQLEQAIVKVTIVP